MAEGARAPRSPGVDNIKVANVTWHEVIHIDYHRTLRTDLRERSQRTISDLVCRHAG